MYEYRITKYNPILRDKDGIFTQNVWISCSDIGRIYVGKELIFSDYIKVEDNYVNTVKSFMKCLDVPYLQLTELENHHPNIKKKEHYSTEMVDLLSTIKNKQKISS